MYRRETCKHENLLGETHAALTRKIVCYFDKHQLICHSPIIYVI